MLEYVGTCSERRGILFPDIKIILLHSVGIDKTTQIIAKICKEWDAKLACERIDFSISESGKEQNLLQYHNQLNVEKVRRAEAEVR